MTYYLLVLMTFISLLLNGLNRYYDIFKTDLYLFLVPIIFVKIILNLRQNKYVSSKSIVYFLLFIFTIFFSLLVNYGIKENNLNLFKCIKGTFSYLAWPLFFLLSATENSSQMESIRLNKLLWGIGYVMAANSIIPVIIYFATGIEIGEFVIQNGSFRSFGFLTDQLGFALVYFVILSVIEKKYFRTLLFLSSILVTGTRGAIIFAVIALIFSIIFQKDNNFSLKKSSFIIKRGIVIISILMIATISFGDRISSIISLRFDEESIEDTSIQRIGAMKSGFELFLDNPFFGVGIGNFSELVYNSPVLSKFFDYHSALTKKENMRGYANAQNEFVNILVNGGLFSLASVILFIYSSLKSLRKKTGLQRNSEHQKVAFIFLVLSVCLIQSAVYMFNPGVTSFFFLLLLGRGSSNSLY